MGQDEELILVLSLSPLVAGFLVRSPATSFLFLYPLNFVSNICVDPATSAQRA